MDKPYDSLDDLTWSCFTKAGKDGGRLNPYLSHLHDVCHGKGLSLDILGYADDTLKYPVVSVLLNDRPEPGQGLKKTVLFSSGVHGGEIAGPWASLRFLEEYDPKAWPGLRILMFPVANPSGFDRGCDMGMWRNNLRGVNLNRCFDSDPLERECGLLLARLRDEEICFMHSSTRIMISRIAFICTVTVLTQSLSAAIWSIWHLDIVLSIARISSRRRRPTME